MPKNGPKKTTEVKKSHQPKRKVAAGESGRGRSGPKKPAKVESNRPRNHPQFYATDKERFDLLMHAKQKISSDALRAFAIRRGIILSPTDVRDNLVEYISTLSLSYKELDEVLFLCEPGSRPEKFTSIVIDEDIELETLRGIVDEFAKSQQKDSSEDKIIISPKGKDTIGIEVQYSELDYSKTTLIQRRNKNAEIDIISEGNTATIRLPANEKAKSLVEALSSKVSQHLKREIKTKEIDLSVLKTPDQRALFLTKLITSLSGFDLETVTSVNVVPLRAKVEARDIKDTDSTDIDEDDLKSVEVELVGVVQKVALHGDSILHSKEYIDLKSRGFYPSKVVWKSRELTKPPRLIELEASFERAEDGQGFVYNVRGQYKFIEAEFCKTKSPLTEVEKLKFLRLLESMAREVYSEILNEVSVGELKQ